MVGAVDNIPFSTAGLIALADLTKEYRRKQIEQAIAGAEKKQIDERLTMAFGTPVNGMKYEFKA